MLFDFALLLLAFATLWIGAGISINSVEKVARYINISSFLISFFALGILTSVSEISVAVFSIVDKTPGISVGNLVGGSVVLTLLIIPLLAIFNKGIKFSERAEPINFPLVYFVISFPSLLLLDGVLSLLDGFALLLAFAFLISVTSIKNTLLDKIEEVINHRDVSLFWETLKIALGVMLIVVSCKFIVDTAVEYAQTFSVSPFLIGLLLLSIGTNLPELTILVRSTLSHKKDIALGDYVGSAAINTAVLGLLTAANGSAIKVANGSSSALILLPLGAVLFLLFTRNKKLERREGFVLVLLYLLFIAIELLT